MRIKRKHVIHNVQILDASGSMAGANYASALEGINGEQHRLQEDDTARYTQTVIEFSSGWDNKTTITTHSFMQPIKTCTPIVGVGADGGTPLYEAVGVTLDKLLLGIEPGDKVLVKIATDGEENSSQGVYKNGNVLKELIAMCELEGFTITFVGTEKDVFEVVKNIGISMSNTFSRANTPEAISMSYMAMTDSTLQYTSRVVSGQSVTDGFFKED